MESQALLPYFASLLSAIIVGVIAYLFFKTHTDNEEGRRRFLLHKETQSYARQTLEKDPSLMLPKNSAIKNTYGQIAKYRNIWNYIS